MKYFKDQRGALLVVELIILAAVIVVAGFAGYQYLKNSKAANKAGTPKPHIVANSSTSPSPATTEAPTPTPSSTFDISSLGVKFTLSGTVSDLDYQVVHLTGDQAVNSVEFSSKRLEAAGCSLASAPLGYLTYDNNKGGTLVANVRNSNLYYLSPTAGSCAAAPSLQTWQALESSLRSAVSDQ